MTAPRVVLFDLDDTLFAHRAAVADGILLHLDRVGGAFATGDRKAATVLWHELEEEHYHSYLAGDLDFAGQRRARAQDFAASFHVALSDAEADMWFNEYFESYRASWRLHDDALPCFDAMAGVIAGVRFGLITNGEPVFQGEKIRRVGPSSVEVGISILRRGAIRRRLPGRNLPFLLAGPSRRRR